MFLGLPFVSKVREGFLLRLRKHSKGSLPEGAKPIWIHCASGEFEYAKPLIRRIKAESPKTSVLVTYFSPSYRSAIEAFEEIDLSLPLPLDTPGAMNEFLKKYRPQVCLIARSDLWPEMLSQCRKFKVPTILFSATQRRENPVLRLLLSPFRSWIYSLLTEAHCVSEEDRIELLAHSKNLQIFVSGDTRYDQVLFRLDHPRTIHEELKTHKIPILVAGSTWEEDEDVILKCFSQNNLRSKVKLLLVPHEPNLKHIANIKDRLEQYELKYQVYSNFVSWDEVDVVLVDQTGLLAELYSVGQFAFVGGSFKGRVHSVMEGLAAGLMTFVGPYHQNNREAQAFQQVLLPNNKPAVQVVQNSSSLERAVLNSLESNLQVNSDFLKEAIRKRRGASDRLLLRLGEVHPS